MRVSSKFCIFLFIFPVSFCVFFLSSNPFFFFFLQRQQIASETYIAQAMHTRDLICPLRGVAYGDFSEGTLSCPVDSTMPFPFSRRVCRQTTISNPIDPPESFVAFTQTPMRWVLPCEFPKRAKVTV